MSLGTHFAAAGLLLLLLAGCDSRSSTEGFCSTVVIPAVSVEVFNAQSGAPEAEGAFGRIVDGAYVDTLRATRFNADGVPTVLSGGEDRPGTYEITIQKEGFRAWSRSSVVVPPQNSSPGLCGPQTAEFTAQLEPAFFPGSEPSGGASRAQEIEVN